MSTQTDRINGLTGGVAIKVPCQVATTANITLSGLQTIDGVSVTSEMRVLVKDQTDTEDNGIYLADADAWVRAKDFNGARDIAQGTRVYVIYGTAGANLEYQITTVDPVIRTTAIEFSIVAYPVTTSEFMVTVLDDLNAAAARTTLGAAGLTGDESIAGNKTFTGTVASKIGADVASATALSLGVGNLFDITGTTAITSIDTVGVGTMVTLQFDGILTFTHHATNLILPGAANITTAAGDIAILYEYATGDWRCVSYTKAASPPATEGTWTPTIQDVSFSDAEGQTYSVQYGSYTKIGNRVFISCNMTLTSLGTVSGDLYLAGLPFTSSSTSGTDSSFSVDATGMNFLEIGNSVTAYIEPNTTAMFLRRWRNTTGTDALQVIRVTGTASFKVSGSYVVD